MAKIPKQRSWKVQRPAYFAEEIMILVLARRLLENLSKRGRISFSRTISALDVAAMVT
jgi:hypothetical protein